MDEKKEPTQFSLPSSTVIVLHDLKTEFKKRGVKGKNFSSIVNDAILAYAYAVNKSDTNKDTSQMIKEALDHYLKVTSSKK